MRCRWRVCRLTCPATGKSASEMRVLSRPTVRKFNPGVLQSDEELIRQFVVRQDELATVLEVLRDNVDADSCQHLLVVAPRGQGKTMLLARAAAELRTKGDFSEKLMPVRFMEESHEVSSIGDFWLETLFYLANECASMEPDLAKELQAAHADLASAWQDRDYSDRARATVLAAADQLGKQLVLMVENLQDLCDDVDADFGWQLRESLQMEPAVMLLATATSRFKMLDDAREPFFELFMTISLEPLDTEECRRLWQAASGEPAELRDVRPLEILTGGSPRLLTIVAALAQHHSVRRLMEDLVTLVDDHTDYFRSHLEVLPKTERRIYVAAISLWRPSSTSEIAARARMDVRLASSMLGRLVARGALIATGRARRRRYAAAERLYCLYYKLRRERDEAHMVQMLIRFMAVFYSKARDADMRARLVEDVRHDPLIRRALIEAAMGDPDVLASDSEASLAALDQEMCAPDIDAVDLAERMKQKWMLLYQLRRYGDMRVVCEEIIDRSDKDFTSLSRYAVVLARFYRALAIQEMDDTEGAIGAYSDIISMYNSENGETAVVVEAAMIKRAYLYVKAEHRQEDRVCLRGSLHDQDKHAFLARHMAHAMLEMGSLQAEASDTWRVGLETWKALIDRFTTSNDPVVRQHVAMAYSKIVTLLTNHNLAERVLETCEEAIEYIEDGDEAEIRAHGARFLLVLGWAQRSLGRIDDALSSHDDLDLQFGDIGGLGGLAWRWHAGRERVLTYYKAGMNDRWREMLRRLYAMLDTGREKMLADLHEMVVLMAAREGAPDVLAVELAVDPGQAEALRPLIVALRMRAGKSVRAPAEVMDVAEDILKEIEERRLRSAAEFAVPKPQAGNEQKEGP